MALDAEEASARARRRRDRAKLRRSVYRRQAVRVLLVSKTEIGF